jgi:hypothetical protein
MAESEYNRTQSTVPYKMTFAVDRLVRWNEAVTY